MPKAVKLRSILTPEAIAIEKTLQVKDKDTGKIIPFKLNAVQRRYDMQWTGRDKWSQESATRDIVNKARQQGISALITAYILIMALNKPYFRAIILTHVGSSSEVLLDKIKFYLEHPQKNIGNFEVIEEKTLVDNRKVIKLSNGSSIVITTANNKNTAVGDTADAIHASEVSRWKKSTIDSLKTGLLQTLPRTGHLWYESTSNGLDGFFYDITMQSYLDTEGTSPHWQHFFSWIESPEYSKPFKTVEDRERFMNNLRSDLEEEEAIELCRISEYGIPTPEQMYWRRDKILSDFIKDRIPNLSAFKQEYPSTLLESFQTSVNSLFKKFNWIENEPRWKFNSDRNYWYLEGHPKADHTYVAGVDTAAGIGKDYTFLDIWDVDTQEQVAQWFSNTVDPIAAAYIHAPILWLYKAFLVAEINNHGYSYVSHMIEVYPQDMMYHEDRYNDKEEDSLGITGLGFKTGARKPLWINRYSNYLTTMQARIYSSQTAVQLSSFTETDSGKLEGGDKANDDAVISGLMTFIGMWNLDRIPLEQHATHAYMQMASSKPKVKTILELVDENLESWLPYDLSSNLIGEEEWNEMEL
jgi:hypothetical protein